MAVDQTLKPDPKRKGSYYRRIEDIHRGLKAMNADRLSGGVKVFVYFFGCEKLALGIVGIHKQQPANVAYRIGRNVDLKDTIAASRALGLSVSDDDLNYLFAAHNQQPLLSGYHGPHNRSARHLRNRLVHDFGPSNANNLMSQSSFLIPKMEKFIKCIPSVLGYLRSNFSNIP